MTGSTRSPTCAALASLAALVLLLPATSGAARPRQPLPVYLEDNHAGTFQFLATTLNLDAPHVLVLVDAHSDSSRPAMLDEVRVGLRRVVTPGERDARISGWRRAGALQSFDWILPLMPAPLSRVLWVKADPEPRAGAEAAPLPAGFASCPLEELGTRIAEGEAVVVSIDLDAFAGTSAAEQEARFARVWSRVTSLPRLAAVSFAISRPWLADDAEASRLVLLASRASLALAHATFRFEPWGIEGPDRSQRAKAFYLQRKEPPRFDPETVSPELRTLLLANADRLEVRIDHARWHDLLARWRAEGSDWRITLQGLAADSDHVFRPGPERAPDLRVEGGPAGRVRRVTWLGWTPRAWSYDVLPELPSGKVFAGAAPPVIDYESHVLARTGSPTLDAEAWMAALPGSDRSGVLRVSAEVETVDGIAHTARLELRRAVGTGFRAGLSEQFGLPYVFGAGFLRSGGLTGPDTGVGNDCANFLVSAWRRSGLPMPWSNPAQLRRHLASVARDASASHRVVIPSDASVRGLVVHLGSHVAALWEDRPPLGTLGPEDLMVHHLGGAPEILSLEKLLAGRRSPTFDVYLGPPRRPTRWIAVGGDVMPGDGAPPEAIRRRLRAADLAVANLETTVGSAGRPVEKRYTFQIPSARLADVRGLPLSAVSLGNNHTGDFGVEGLAGTLAALDASGVGHFGAGDDVQAAVSPWYVEVKGVTVAFVAASLTDPDLLPAGERRSGIAVLPRHERALAAAIA
ncbi:MAG: CapA family protein, partial [Anaeromyxobacteraceae bacterium]